MGQPAQKPHKPPGNTDVCAREHDSQEKELTLAPGPNRAARKEASTTFPSRHTITTWAISCRHPLGASSRHAGKRLSPITVFGGGGFSNSLHHGKNPKRFKSFGQSPRRVWGKSQLVIQAEGKAEIQGAGIKAEQDQLGDHQFAGILHPRVCSLCVCSLLCSLFCRGRLT